MAAQYTYHQAQAIPLFNPTAPTFNHPNARSTAPAAQGENTRPVSHDYAPTTPFNASGRQNAPAAGTSDDTYSSDNMTMYNLLHEAWVREGISCMTAKAAFDYGNQQATASRHWQNEYQNLHSTFLQNLNHTQVLIAQQRESQPALLENITLRKHIEYLKNVTCPGCPDYIPVGTSTVFGDDDEHFEEDFSGSEH